MAERRVQVRDPNDSPVGLSPQARPTDPFQVPSALAPSSDPSGLLEIASALKEVNPALQKYVEDKTKKITEEELAEGEALFHKNRVDFKQAVDQGLIPAGANPHRLRGYRLAQLRHLGNQFVGTLQQEWAASDVRGSDNPAAFDQFIRERTASYMDANLGGFKAEEVNEAFAPAIKQAHAIVTQQQTVHRVQAIEEKSYAAASQTIADAANRLDLEGVAPGSTETLTRVKATASAIEAEMAELTQDGLPFAKVNEMVVDTLVARAKETLNADLMRPLQHIKSGTGVLGNTAKSRAKIIAARSYIANQKVQAENHAWIARQRDKERRVESTQSLGLAALLSNPKADLTAFYGQLNKIGSEGVAAVQRLSSLQSSLLTRKFEGDPAAERALLARIWRGTAGIADIISELRDGKLDATMALRAQTELTERQKAGNFLKDEAVMGFAKGLRRIILGNDFAISEEAERLAADNAFHDFVNTMRAWERNPNNSGADRTVAAQEVAKNLRWKYASIVAISAMLNDGETPPKDFDIQSRFSAEAIYRKSDRGADSLLKVRTEFLKDRPLFRTRADLRSLTRAYNLKQKAYAEAVGTGNVDAVTAARTALENDVLTRLARKFGFANPGDFVMQQRSLIQQ